MNLLAAAVFAGCFAVLLAIHLLVVLNDIRRELRRLRTPLDTRTGSRPSTSRRRKGKPT